MQSEGHVPVLHALGHGISQEIKEVSVVFQHGGLEQLFDLFLAVTASQNHFLRCGRCLAQHIRAFVSSRGRNLFIERCEI